MRVRAGRLRPPLELPGGCALGFARPRRGHAGSLCGWKSPELTAALDGLAVGLPESLPIAKRDMDRVFEYQKLAGPKFNDMVAIKDQIKPHATVDRMVAASIAKKSRSRPGKRSRANA